ncbi:MAG: undecaprenyl-diphosphate phosphatase [Pseudomonadota bacterium]
MDFLSLLKAMILGVVEGATEFIPVSSTGHLILVQNWLNFNGRVENAFLIFIQLGAILAVLWLYRKKFLSVALNWRRDPDARRLIINLIIGTIPAVIIGLPTEKWIEAHFFKPIPVSMALVFGGVLILLIERWGKKASVKIVDDIPIGKAFGVGMIQVLAILFPGVSRSGATIMGGLCLGLSRIAATEFSFFLAIPAMLGASLVKLIGVYGEITLKDLPVFFIGLSISFVVGLAVIRGLLSFVSRNSFAAFAWYRIIFGAALLSYWGFTGNF